MTYNPFQDLGKECTQFLEQFQRGLEYVRQTPPDHQNSAECFRQCLAVCPESVPARNNLGFSLYQMGNLIEAEETLAKLVEEQPAFEAARINLGNLLATTGRPEIAIAHFQVLTEGDSSDYAWARLFELYNEVGLRDEAFVALGKASGYGSEN